MSEKTGIEWTDATWNPATGCTRVSPGCDHCYIERQTPLRIERRQFDKPGPGGTTGVVLHPGRLGLPLKWRDPKRIFVNSMSDLFHEAIPDTYIADVYATMARADWHTFQVLTKRHGRMRSLLSSPRWPELLTRNPNVWPSDLDPERPLGNVWLGVTVENQQWADIRVPALLDTPAAVRFLSCEPLLGPVSLFGDTETPGPADRIEGGSYRTDYGTGIEYDAHTEPGIDWVIVGGESGPDARPMHPAWARSLRAQCTAAGVAFHFKQFGEWLPVEPNTSANRLQGDWDVRLRDGYAWPISEAHGADEGQEATVRRVGKKAAGRVLDGRTWDEYPQTAVPA